MTASVRLSVKTVRAMFELARAHAGCPGPGPVLSFASIAEVERALRPSQKKKLVRKANKAARETKAKTKREARADIREAVLKRADGRCEACATGFTPLNSAELDHFFGKARSEAVETCWALCRQCHAEKTDNEPSAADWLQYFVSHCGQFGYVSAAMWAKRRAAFVSVRSALSERREGA